MPHVVTNHTYMADADIFITEYLLDPRRFNQISYHNVLYSNIIRKNTMRLTGVMLADAETIIPCL